MSLEVGDSGTRKVKRKKEVRKELRRWKRAGADDERYRMAKREYEKLCDKKKREENERWEKPMTEARREEDVWEVVNRQRKKRKEMNEGIEMEV